jgi:uncharacterized protein (DUF1330 family)
MTAYVVIIRNQTVDARHFEQYFALAPLAPAQHASYVAKNSEFEVLEGPPAETVVIVSFPSMREARAWYRSDEYQQAVQHRLKAADYRTLLVDGVVNLTGA